MKPEFLIKRGRKLKNVIINQDTIHSINIGLLNKRYKLKVYLKSIKTSKKEYQFSDVKEYKKWAKKYKIDIKDFIKGVSILNK